MVAFSFLHGRNIKVYKNGVYLTTLTDASLDITQNTVDRTFIGDDTQVTIATTKTFGGKFTRDLLDEGTLEEMVGNIITTRFNYANYYEPPTTVQDTVNNATMIDVPFTTPNKTGLTLDAIIFNAKRVGDFVNGMKVEVWEGAAGSGTLKTTFTFAELDLPTLQTYIEGYKSPESAEVAITANAAHTLRFAKVSGTPTGSIQLFGPSAATEPYFAITYEMSIVEQADYYIDFNVINDAGTTVMTFRDTGVTFLSEGLTIVPTDPLSEATEWRANSRTLI